MYTVYGVDDSNINGDDITMVLGQLSLMVYRLARPAKFSIMRVLSGDFAVFDGNLGCQMR